MSSDSTKARRPSLAKNTVAMSTPLFVGYIASFVSAPIVLDAIGLRAFGTWALTGALAQYAGLLDFGVGPSLTRFVALYDADGREDLVGEVMAAGVSTSFLICSVLAGASLIVASPLAHHLGGISTGDMRALLLSATSIFLSSTLVNALTAYRIGLREMVAPNVIATLGAITNFCFSIGAVLASHSVVVYAVANAAASGITLAATAAYLLLFSRPRAPYRRPTLATSKTLISFSVKNQAQTAATLVNTQTDKLIIALFIGPAAAGAYELANRVAAAARSIGVYTGSAMVPTLTAELRGATPATWADTYERLTRRTTAIAVPILVLTAALAPLILGAWLGRDPSHSAFVIAALSLGYIVNTTTGVGFAVCYAAGYPGIPAKSAVTMAIANIVLTVSLAPLFGIWGVLSGTALAFTGGSFVQVWLLHKRLAIPLARYWRATLPTERLAAVLAAPVVACSVLLNDTGRGLQICAVCIAGASYLVAYTFLANRSGALPESVTKRLTNHGRLPRITRGIAP